MDGSWKIGFIVTGVLATRLYQAEFEMTKAALVQAKALLPQLTYADDHPGNKIPALRFTFEITPSAGRRPASPAPGPLGPS